MHEDKNDLWITTTSQYKVGTTNWNVKLVLENISDKCLLLEISLQWKSISLGIIRLKGQSKNGCYKKTKPSKFSEKQIFLIPWYANTFL